MANSISLIALKGISEKIYMLVIILKIILFQIYSLIYGQIKIVLK